MLGCLLSLRWCRIWVIQRKTKNGSLAWYAAQWRAVNPRASRALTLRLRVWTNVMKWEDSQYYWLMEEIPNNHLGCIKPCKWWEKVPTSTGEPDFFHQQYLSGWGQTGAFSVSIYAEIGTIVWNVRASVSEVAIEMNGSRCIPILALIAHQVKVIWCNCQKKITKYIKTTLLHEWSGHQSSGEIPRWII